MPSAAAGLLIAAIAGALLAVTEAVQLELIKTIAVIVAALGSAYAARQAHCARTELQRRRREVRRPDSEHVLVVESPPAGEPGAHRRRTDRTDPHQGG